MLGAHLIFSAYGFWLPNDPRGSGSDFVRSFDLLRYGIATKVRTRRSVASKKHDSRLRLEAKKALRYPPVQFSGIQARAVGRGFADYAERSHITVWACSIMPDHVHMVIAPTNIDLNRLIGQFKSAATRQLMAESLHPFASFSKGTLPCCWARKGWKVYLDTFAELLGSNRYAENNPLKDGLRRQRWSFVTPYPQLRVSGSSKESAAGSPIESASSRERHSPRSPSENR